MSRIARVDATSYARTRNSFDGAVTGLSPYLTHGVVTLRDVLGEVLKRQPLPVGHKLVYELGWREFFRHAWSHEGDRILQSLHPGPLPEDAYAQLLPCDIREARTGVPVIDQAVRTLYRTGTLHNHARMWLASYVVHLRKVHWRAGADWLVAHLLDGDLASNHLSWQWVAGTGSSKPYLFNAENVSRYAPPDWHSPGSVVDLPYEVMDQIARGQSVEDLKPASPRAMKTAAMAEPSLRSLPPPELQLCGPSARDLELLQDRHVWLVHPWALRPPPAHLPEDMVVIGIYLNDHHGSWPWPAARWCWVDAAMRELTETRWLVNAPDLGALLAGAASVRSIADPHVSRWLAPVAKLITQPTLFPIVDRRCSSFSQWWKRATRGLNNAEELL